MWNIIIFFLSTACLVLKDTLKYFTPEYILTVENPILKYILEAVAVHPLTTTGILSIFLAVTSSKGFIIEPRKKANALKKRIIKRINYELFGNDLQNHRVTLFREVGYFTAWFHYRKATLYHLFRCPNKFPYYRRLPPYGRYLLVDTRAGTAFQRSSTMFRVEQNDMKKCEGIVGLTRLKGGVVLNDLPDLSRIDLGRVKLRGRSADAEAVREYMNTGCIRSIEMMRKIHRHARHFCGTLVQNQEGKIWGVLLVDSTNDVTPFDDNTRKRFESFATTLGDIL